MKTFKRWLASVVWAVVMFLGLLAVGPRSAMAWDVQPNDQEFKGVVLFDRGVYLDIYNPTGLLRASAAELSQVAASNGFVRLGLAAAALAVPTNGATLTPTNVVWSLTATGAGVTNALTLGAPSGPTGAVQVLILRVATGQTNWVGLADSGIAILSAAWAGNGDDSLTLISIPDGTNWVEIARSSN